MKIRPKQISVNNKSKKRTRGYRLKPSTHRLILKIQKILKSDQDEAITASCSMFLTELKKNDPAKKIKISLIK